MSNDQRRPAEPRPPFVHRLEPRCRRTRRNRRFPEPRRRTSGSPRPARCTDHRGQSSRRRARRQRQRVLRRTVRRADGRAMVHAAQKPAAWSSVRETTLVGDRSRRLRGPDLRGSCARSARNDDKDCLNVDASRRARPRRWPVMVSLTAATFERLGQLALVRQVRASLAARTSSSSRHHRLNGRLLYLESSSSADYAGASNVGVLDIVAALTWVGQHRAIRRRPRERHESSANPAAAAKSPRCSEWSPRRACSTVRSASSGSLINGVPEGPRNRHRKRSSTRSA